MTTRLRRRLIGGVAVVATVWMISRAGLVLIVDAPIDRPDAIVSLASHEWERLPRTAELARLYPAAIVVLTQPGVVTVHNCHRCPYRADDLGALGVARDRIQFVALKSGGTNGEALAIRDFAVQKSLRRVLIVTSPYHTRRALAVFRSVLSRDAVQVGIAAASSTSPARPGRWWLAGYDRWYVTYEWAAVGYYAFRYGVWAFI